MPQTKKYREKIHHQKKQLPNHPPRIPKKQFRRYYFKKKNRMKKSFIFAGLISASLASCVTLGKYEALEATNNQIKKEHNITKQELIEMREENSELLRQNQSLTSRVKDLSETTDQQIAELQKLRSDMGNMKLSYDTLIENYQQRINGQSRDINKMNGQLAARDKELNDREVAFAAKEQAFLTQQRQLENKQAELQTKQAQLQKQEAATRATLEAKEKELEQVRNSVTKALVGFQNKGLNVETKYGKVYVSMESKLMFASGSWTVSKEGMAAIKELAKVLEQNPDLNIMVEGHTDNVSFKGQSAVKDNWDLSVMRATAIVKLILQYGPTINPARIEASGHSEFDPKVENSSPENKAINRRTEIILTPNVNDLLKIVSPVI